MKGVYKIPLFRGLCELVCSLQTDASHAPDVATNAALLVKLMAGYP
jgi:hypothetical protein